MWLFLFKYPLVNVIIYIETIKMLKLNIEFVYYKFMVRPLPKGISLFGDFEKALQTLTKREVNIVPTWGNNEIDGIKEVKITL